MQGVFRDLFEGAIAVAGTGVAIALSQVVVAQSVAYTIAPTLTGFQQALSAAAGNTNATNIINDIQSRTLSGLQSTAVNTLNSMGILASLLVLPVITLVFAIVLGMLIRLTAIAG